MKKCLICHQICITPCLLHSKCNCKYIVHGKCYYKWWKINKKCLICREKVDDPFKYHINEMLEKELLLFIFIMISLLLIVYSQ